MPELCHLRQYFASLSECKTEREDLYIHLQWMLSLFNNVYKSKEIVVKDNFMGPLVQGNCEESQQMEKIAISTFSTAENIIIYWKV